MFKIFQLLINLYRVIFMQISTCFTYMYLFLEKLL